MSPASMARNITRRGGRIRLPVRFIRPVIHLWVLVAVMAQTAAQQSSPDADPAIDQPLSALAEIRSDYVDYLAKRTRIHDDYRKVEETLRQTAEDLQRIGNDALRQQLLAMQSTLQSMQIEETLFGLTNDTATPAAGARRRTGPPGVEGNLLRAKAVADLDVAIRAVQLNQLDAASQATVRRRLDCIQTGMTLQNEWLQWQQGWPTFLQRYWPHADPERRFTRQEIDARLAILRDAAAEDYAAMIASALLLERLGRYEDALVTIDRVIAARTVFDSTALCVKGLVLNSRQDDKASKDSLQLAAKRANRSPFDRWIRAQIAASRGEFAAAEAQWKTLVTLKPFELEARRSLALVAYARSEKTPSAAKQSLKEARLAFDLEPTHDWFSHLVLALALRAAKDDPEAAKELDQARELATDENAALCERLRETIDAGEPFVWDFGAKIEG